MAEIKFYANIKDQTGDGELINHSAGSGLGFYGNGFGISVPVGSQQTTTFVTNANGTDEGARLNNTSLVTSGTNVTAGTVSINSASAVNLDKLPNYLCPLNIRFTHTEAVKVQNCKLRIFDRDNIDNHASGVVTYVYEARHPASSQVISNLSHRGRAANSWYQFDPVEAMVDMPFTTSPGVSGTNTNSQDTSPTLAYTSNQGSLHTSTRHDWYVALSSEPITIGSKTQYGLYFTVEYL
ncbi:hypothetical protein EB001_09895 [bacterium]|nr:hypothetical protein [bacterium]